MVEGPGEKKTVLGTPKTHVGDVLMQEFMFIYIYTMHYNWGD